MNDLFQEISHTLSKTEWEGTGKKRKIINFPVAIPSNWPMSNEIRLMLDKVDEQGRSVGEHVKGVVASTNKLITPDLAPRDFLITSENVDLNGRAYSLMAQARGFCWFDTPVLFKGIENEFAKGILRIAALYHDIGKLISSDHHVIRGIRFMRDVNESYRREIENLFDNVNDSRDFWALLRHHDTFGCLCTGEASLAALSDMISWSYPRDQSLSIEKTELAYISYLAWLNIADIDSTLLNSLGGITTVEAYRYLTDWGEIKKYLANDKSFPSTVNREEFKNWALSVSSQPERTILRITRLVATCYRKEMGAIAPEFDIQVIVEEELRAVHGPRFERFCYRFARFCKLDYGLRFFYLFMRDSLLDQQLLERTDNSDPLELPKNVQRSNKNNKEAILRALRNMVKGTCLILHRVVEDYGELVSGYQNTGALIGVDMSGLMRPEETGWAICRSLKESPSRALGWVADEISVRLYGD